MRAPVLFAANDCLDIGKSLGSPVSLDYYDRAPSRSAARSIASMSAIFRNRRPSVRLKKILRLSTIQRAEWRPGRRSRGMARQ
jgi:hypothetical protein